MILILQDDIRMIFIYTHTLTYAHAHSRMCHMHSEVIPSSDGTTELNVSVPWDIFTDHWAARPRCRNPAMT